jgi:hypothetical protein
VFVKADGAGRCSDLPDCDAICIVLIDKILIDFAGDNFAGVNHLPRARIHEALQHLAISLSEVLEHGDGKFVSGDFTVAEFVAKPTDNVLEIDNAEDDGRYDESGNELSKKA